MNVVYLIGWRYLQGAGAHKSISAMVIICFCGIFIGTLALALVASIMNGFEKITHQKLQGIHAQIIMRSYGNELNAPAIEVALKTVPEIAAYSPATFKQVIIQNTNSDDITNAVLLKGVDPHREATTSTIGNKIIAHQGTEKNFTALLHHNQIAIGAKLAEYLHLAVGDTVNLLYLDPEAARTARSHKITLDSQKAIVSAIFSTGIEEFDAGMILCSLEFLQKIYPGTLVSQFNIQLAPGADEALVIKQLQKQFNLEVFSWKELYPALVSALKLEKYAMFFILALIALVASMSIVSLIFMQIIQKRPDIAILTSMGMRSGTIAALFIIMGMVLAISAAIAGLCGAFLIGLLLEKYPFIALPDTYYVTHLPIYMEWHIFLAVLGLVILMSFVATWLPTRSIKMMNVASALRAEG